jgi:histidine ammonia-lyase
MTVVVDGDHLTVEQLVAVARHDEPVALGRGVVERMAQSREIVRRVLERDDPVYGMTTGLGASKRHRVELA